MKDRIGSEASLVVSRLGGKRGRILCVLMRIRMEMTLGSLESEAAEVHRCVKALIFSSALLH
jgi:hypothetical protein